MRLLFFFTVLVFSFAVAEKSALAGSVLPEASTEEDYEKYDRIHSLIMENSQSGAGIEQSLTIMLSMLQIMPVDERQKLIIDLAKQVQVAAPQQRHKGLETAAGFWASIPQEKKQHYLTQIQQTLKIMSSVEQQILAVQLGKLKKDLPSIPMEDRNVLSPLMDVIVRTAFPSGVR